MRPPLRVVVMADTLPPKGHTGGGMAHAAQAVALAAEGAEVRTFTFMELPKPWKYAVKAVLRSLLWVAAFLRRPWRKPGLRLELDTALLGALSGRALLGRVRAWNPDWVVVPDYGACAAFWPLEWRRRLVVVAHSGPLRFLGLPLIGLRDPLDARLAWALEARMSREAAASVVPSLSMRRTYERDYPRRGAVTVVPNLLDEPALAGVKSAALGPRGIKHRVFLPSPGNRNKGSAVLEELLVSLAKRLAPERVAFVVSGALDAGLERALRARLPAHAVLLAPGSRPHAETMAWMKSCRLCLSPTLIESFGMALLEAQFCGLPVVCFDVEATPEVVSQGRTGVLVALADTQALASAAATLLKDPARLARYGRAASKRARGRFSARRGGRAFVRLLSGLERA